MAKAVELIQVQFLPFTVDSAIELIDDGAINYLKMYIVYSL